MPCTAVVAFGKNLGSAVQTALLAIAGSVVGAALGVLIIALLSGLSPGFSYSTHPITMVRFVPLCCLHRLQSSNIPGLAHHLGHLHAQHWNVIRECLFY